MEKKSVLVFKIKTLETELKVRKKMLELQEIMEEEITGCDPTESITVYGARILANIEYLEYRLNLYFQFCGLAQALYVLKNSFILFGMFDKLEPLLKEIEENLKEGFEILDTGFEKINESNKKPDFLILKLDDTIMLDNILDILKTKLINLERITTSNSYMDFQNMDGFDTEPPYTL